MSLQSDAKTLFLRFSRCDIFLVKPSSTEQQGKKQHYFICLTLFESAKSETRAIDYREGKVLFTARPGQLVSASVCRLILPSLSASLTLSNSFLCSLHLKKSLPFRANISLIPNEILRSPHSFIGEPSQQAKQTLPQGPFELGLGCE